MIRRWKLRVIRNWLLAMNATAVDRIDFYTSFDDDLYRTREATGVLLDIYWGEQR